MGKKIKWIESIFESAVLFFWVFLAGLSLLAGGSFLAIACWNGNEVAGESRAKFEVNVLRELWLDFARHREIPVKIYYPAGKKDSSAVVIFSHGLGGSREGYEYLGRFWAENGLISVHLQHPGSDDQVWKGQSEPLAGMKKAARNPLNALERARDVIFCLNKLDEINRGEGVLKGLIDYGKIGLAGHSFGAHTTLLLAGQLIILPGGREISLVDSRIKAAIPMSAPVPADRSSLERVYSKIKIPCLHMTGTLDDSPIGETRAEERRIPFDYIKGADQYLVIFKGGDHMIFSGRPRLFQAAGQKQKDREFQKMIQDLSLYFWRTYLFGDEEAGKWLKGEGARKKLGDLALFELKLSAPRNQTF